MPNLTVDSVHNLFDESFLITQALGTQLTLETENTFLDKDIQLTLNVQPGVIQTPSTTITSIPVVYNSVTNSGYVVKNDTIEYITPVVVQPGYVSTTGLMAGMITITGETAIAASTLSNTSIIPEPTTAQIVTIGAGYYPNDRTVTIQPMSSGTNANITSLGVINTVPQIDISGTCTMAISTTATNYYFSRIGTIISNGIVDTKYQVTTAGYAAITSPTYSSSITVVPTKTADDIIYIPAAVLTTTATGGLLAVSSTSTYIELTNTNTDNNQIKISFNTTRAETIFSTTVTAGYIETSSITSSQSSYTQNQDYYVKGVTLTTPLSGTSTFYLTFPNGDNDTMTFHFEIDTNGNVTIS